jgi:hypothetical protein
MNDWTGGYVADIGYTYGYYRELNPLRARLVLLAAGIAPPPMRTACELGFGQGLSVAVHAAAGATRWWGNDFLPAQAGFARALTDAAGAQAELTDQSFADFLRRDDLPRFDYIGLHGVWSWVSAEERARIVEFVRRHLEVGGVLYLSYNTLVGWARMLPLRRLLIQHYRLMSGPGAGTARRIGEALAFADRLPAVDARHLRADPELTRRLHDLMGRDARYLAHEYFNRDWTPMDFADVAELLAVAKLDYAGSAHYLDWIDAINLNEAQQALLADIDSVALRENTRDFCVDKAFRKDYWIKGARRLTPLQVAQALRAERVVLARPRQTIALEVEGPLGVADLAEPLYLPLLDHLADGLPHSLGEIEQALSAGAGLDMAAILHAVIVLAHRGDVQAAQPDTAIAQARSSSRRLNAHLLDRARGDGQIAFLASPVTGGGVEASRFQQLFLLGVRHGCTDAASLARFTWSILAPQGEGVLRDGKVIESPEDNVAELQTRAQTFLDSELPLFAALGVAEHSAPAGFGD